MKKSTLLAIAAAALMGTSAMAQEAQEVQYTTDPAQGYIVNRFQDNWFITAEGGANVLFGQNDSHRKFGDRFAPQASIYVGKWFSPVFGGRIGAEWLQLKGLTPDADGIGVRLDEPMINGYYKHKVSHLGPVADLMVNLTNWWCGYHPNRVYECIFYGGAGGYFTMERKYDADGEADGWKNAHDCVLTVRAGLINQFNLSKHFSIGLDLRYAVVDNHADRSVYSTNHDVQANLAFTYRFNKTSWTAPVVPVVTPTENCDAYRARLQAADARIADLEAQLRDCLNRPATVKEVKSDAPLATIYFPINVSTLTRTDRNVLKAVAGVMTSHPEKTYTVTGWADNYTGNNAINTRLRKARAASVEAQLKKNGVPASQLDVTINDGNLCDLGEKYVALDRAVTINEK